MSDPIITYLILIAVSLLAGAINAVAGGGTLLTFPALFTALNGNGVLANGTSTVAVVPGSLAGAWGYRSELADKRAILMRLLWPSLIGGTVGALLVTRFPERIFNELVPWLILTATFLFLLQKPLQAWLGAHQHDKPPASRTVALLILFQFVVAIYGGYFGAGMGIVMLATLGLMAVGDIHHMNGVKSVLAVAINGMAVVVFVAEGQVRWNYALPMAAATIVGGYVGARGARRLPAVYVRWIVIAIGLGLSAYYFGQRL
jgi:uncharacterized membrane protein YfcA